MQIPLLYLSTALVFLLLDAVMLTRVMQPLFSARLGAQLLDELRIVPAIGFYLFYLSAVLVFVSLPALHAGAPGRAFFFGLLFGAAAYGTYEFTNYATLRDWHWSMVAIDTAWGAVLTGFSAYVGVLVTRAVTG